MIIRTSRTLKPPHGQLRRLISAVFIALVPLSTLTAELPALPGMVPLPVEADISLFPAQKGTDGTELRIKGSWEMNLESVFAIDFSSDPGVAAFLRFPGAPLLFTQTTDILLDLTLFKKWYVEASVLTSFEDNTYAIGYRGDETDFVKHVRIGNSAIGFPSYPYLPFGNAPPGTFGAIATLGGDTWRTDFAVRYDTAKLVTRTFYGNREKTEQAVSASAYVRGRFFSLPHSGITNVLAFEEDADGTNTASDGKKFRRLGSSEFDVSATKGFLSLKKAASGRIAVSYSESGSVPTFPGGFSIDGTSVLIVYGLAAPGYYEDCSWYSVPDASVIDDSTEFEVRIVETGMRDGDFFGVWDDSESLFKIAHGSAVDPKSVLANKPFSLAAPEAYSAERFSVLPSRSIIIRNLQKTSGIVLGNDVMPGSVGVRRNGSDDSSFAFDPETGEVILSRLPQANERIDVFFYERSKEARDGLVTIGLGAVYEPSKDLSVQGGLGFQFNPDTSGFSSSGDRNPSRAIAAAGISYRTEALEASAAISADWQRYDGRGIYRIDGMEKSGIILGFSGSGMFRSAASSRILPLSPESERGILYYKNYSSVDALGNISLMTLDWQLTQDRISDPGLKQGPYPVSDDTVKNTCMVLDYSIQGAESWVGGHYVLPDAYRDSVRASTGMKVYYRKLDAIGGDPDFFIELGALASGPDTADSLSGIEQAGAVASFDVESLSYTQTYDASSGWHSVDIPFSVSSDLEAIGRANAVRIVARGTSAGQSGKFVLGPIVFRGALFTKSGLGAANVSLQETSDSGLGGVFPGAVARFHPSLEPQKALNVSVSSPGGEVSFERPDDDVPLSGYTYLTFFLGTGVLAGTAPFIEFHATGQGGRLLEARIPLALGSALPWMKICVPLQDGAMVLGQYSESGGRSEISGSSVSVSSLEGVTSYGFSLAGVDSGLVQLDEVCLEEPLDTVSARGKGSLSWRSAETLISVAGIDIMKGVSLSARTEGVMVLDDAAIPTVGLDVSLASQGGMVTFESAWAVKDLVSLEGDALFGFGLNLDPVSYAMKFSQTASKESFARKDAVKLALGNPFSLGLDSASVFRNSSLQQDGTASVAHTNEWFRFAAGLGYHSALGVIDPFSGDAFLPAWIDSWVLVIPWKDESAEKRISTLTAEFFPVSGSGKPLFGMKGGAAYSKTATDNRLDSATLLVAVPFAIESLSFRVGYERVLSGMVSEPSGAMASGFSGDFRGWWNDVSGFLPFYAGVPFFEWFSAASKPSFADYSSGWEKASLVSRTFLEFERKSEGDILDLLIPVEARASFGAKLERMFDSVDTNYLFDGILTTRSLNLFGAFGSLPVFDYYESDEFSISAKTSLVFGESGFLYGNGTLSGICSFFGFKGESLDIDLGFSWNDPDPFLDVNTTKEFRLGSVLRLPSEHHWLIDLYRIVLGTNTEAPALETEIADDGMTWIERIRTGSPKARNDIELAATVSLDETDNVSVLGIPFSIKSSVFVRDIFSGSVFGRIKENLTIKKDLFISSVLISVGITVRFQF